MRDQDSYARRTAVLGGLGLFLGGCSAPTPAASGLVPYSYRYRLSVKVEAFGATYAASSVQEYRFRNGLKALGSMDSGGKGIIGEAISIPLASHGVLVLTLLETKQRPATFGHCWPVDDVAKHAFGPDLRLKTFIGFGRARAIPVSDLPLAVLFPTPSNPNSVMPLTSELGIRVRDAELSLTRAPLTEGVIGQSLPWLDQYLRDGRYLDGKTMQSAALDRSFATSLSPWDFKSTTY